MLAILSAPGSRGDVNPMVAIGRELRSRGFDVVISLAEPYASFASDAGLMAEPVISSERFDRLVGDATMWRPLSGARTIFRDVVSAFLPLHYEVIRRHHRPGETVLVAHPLDFASRTHRDLDPQTPLASVHLAPAIHWDPRHPPRLSPWWWELRRPAWAAQMTHALAERLFVNPLIVPPLTAFRATLGLNPIAHPLQSWWHSPDRILLMYPPWFAPEVVGGLDERYIHAGFPLAGSDPEPIALEVDEPVVFTFGTAHRHSRKLFEQSVAAIQQLNRTAVLLTQHPESLPPDLPRGIQTLGYVSLPTLLRRSSAIVHHGGIGTTCQSLAAGIPQLIRPMAYDQFDNATRVERLGVGQWLRKPDRLTAALDRLLNSPETRQRCRVYAELLSREKTGGDGASRAATAIESLYQSTCRG